MAYMYILKCADGTYYTGSTVDLEKRVWEHENFLGANYTRKKHPIKLVYFEEFQRIEDAFYREKQVQGWSHAKKQALIEKNHHLLPELSKNYSQYRIGTSTGSTSSPQASSVTGEHGTPVVEPVACGSPAVRETTDDRLIAGEE